MSTSRSTSRRRRAGLVSLVGLALLLAGAGTSGADRTTDGARLAKRVLARYAALAQLTARFAQTVDNATFGRQTRSSGTVTLARPGKMRWDYASQADAKKTTMSFRTDGRTLWMVDVASRTYYKQAASQTALPAAVAFFAGGSLTADFRVARDDSGTYGKAGQEVLELVPRDPAAAVATLWLVVDPATDDVVRSIVRNQAGDLSSFSFGSPDTSTVPPATRFIFNAAAARKQGFRLVTPGKPAKPAR